MVASPKGLGPDNDCAGESQQQLQMTDPQLSVSNQDVVVSPKWVLYSKTAWPTDRRS
jgi:hypothetical protein